MIKLDRICPSMGLSRGQINRLCSWMTFLIDLDETIGRKMRVDLSRDQMGMSQSS